MRYKTADVYRHLFKIGCTFDGERFPNGSIWIGPGEQIFMIPSPDDIDGQLYFDADVLDDIFKDRWLGIMIPLPIARYP